MAEYDLDGWTVPDLINPDDLPFHGTAKKKRTKAANAKREGMKIRRKGR